MTQQHVDTWVGCYCAGWPRHQLVPEAFAHPAKFAPGIAFRLIEHALAEGWLSPGDTVADPFGGVALGALPCLLQGLRWIGCELEPHFVDMGQGCACTGLSQANWVRYYGRWSRVSHTHGHHWCPRCLAQAPQGTDDAAPRKRTFRIAPRPGRYDEWALFPHGEQHPVGLLQPRPAPKVPQKTFAFLGLPFPDRSGRHRPPPRAQALFAQQTASYARNSGLIPTTLAHVYEGNRGLWARQGHGQAVLLQGDSRQLCAVLGEQVGCVVSSPPYAEGLSKEHTYQDHTKRAKDSHRRIMTEKGIVDPHYGTTPGNLGNLPSGELAAVISSPPFLGARAGTTASSPTQGGGPCAERVRSVGTDGNCMGTTPGNLGNLPPGELAAVISSPPYATTSTQPTGLGQGKGTRAPGDSAGRNKGDYHYPASPGQLGAMPSGELAAIVTSPPYLPETDRLRKHEGKAQDGEAGFRNFYSDDPANLGNPVGAQGLETFWSAARTILAQCFALLPAGGHAIFVTKPYVRNGSLVPFPEQWRAVCEHVGFVLLHEHHALLSTQHGQERDLFGGEDVTRETRKLGFFRRLSEKRGAPRIEAESIHCFVKP